METTKNNDLGSIHISDKAISAIAAQTAAQIPFVQALDASFVENAARHLGRGSLAQGAETKITGNAAEITIRLIVKSGCRIPDLALKVQKIVKERVERFTGCTVTAVHIIITGIVFLKPEEEHNGSDQQRC